MVIESDEYLPEYPDEQFEPENTAEEIPEPEQQSPIAEKSQPDFEETSQDVPASLTSETSKQPEILRYSENNVKMYPGILKSPKKLPWNSQNS